MLGKMGKALESIQECCSSDFLGDHFGVGFGGSSHIPQLSHKSQSAAGLDVPDFVIIIIIILEFWDYVEFLGIDTQLQKLA